MPELIELNKLEFVDGKCLNSKSPYIMEALRRMRKKRMIDRCGFDDVIDPLKMLNEIFKISDEVNKKRGNLNARVQ